MSGFQFSGMCGRENPALTRHRRRHHRNDGGGICGRGKNAALLPRVARSRAFPAWAYRDHKRPPRPGHGDWEVRWHWPSAGSYIECLTRNFRLRQQTRRSVRLLIWMAALLHSAAVGQKLPFLTGKRRPMKSFLSCAGQIYDRHIRLHLYTSSALIVSPSGTLLKS